MSLEWESKLKDLVAQNKVVVCMRGAPEQPRCGFSYRVANIFKALEVPFVHLDMDSDPELWQTLREMNQWRTSPQIFINGEFVGGCDIVTELYESGELKNMVTV